MSEFHAEVPQATESEGLAQGSYVVARVGFKPAILRTKDAKSTNEPQCMQCVHVMNVCNVYVCTYTCMYAYVCI